MCLSGPVALFGGVCSGLRVRAVLRDFFPDPQDSQGWPRAFNFALLASVKAAYTFWLSRMNSLCDRERAGQTVCRTHFQCEPRIFAVPLE